MATRGTRIPQTPQMSMRNYPQRTCPQTSRGKIRKLVCLTSGLSVDTNHSKFNNEQVLLTPITDAHAPHDYPDNAPVDAHPRPHRQNTPQPAAHKQDRNCNTRQGCKC
jgi:hypothetical protein